MDSISPLIRLLDRLSYKYGVELHNMTMKRVFEYVDKSDRDLLHDTIKFGGRKNDKSIN
tara:strand:- start:1518 stop:1694 length:177 start_codon:yes stop_codon:yes gene_type:complete